MKSRQDSRLFVPISSWNCARLRTGFKRYNGRWRSTLITEPARLAHRSIGKCVDVHRSGQPDECLENPAEVSGEPILPGFTLRLKTSGRHWSRLAAEASQNRAPSLTWNPRRRSGDAHRGRREVFFFRRIGGGSVSRWSGSREGGDVGRSGRLHPRVRRSRLPLDRRRRTSKRIDLMSFECNGIL